MGLFSLGSCAAPRICGVSPPARLVRVKCRSLEEVGVAIADSCFFLFCFVVILAFLPLGGGWDQS